MTCYIVDAFVDGDLIDIHYNRDIPGGIYKERFTFRGVPNGNWQCISFKHGELLLDKFLDVMIIKNIEVIRMQALLALESYESLQHSIHTRLRLMNAMCAIDDTFIPPGVNKTCRWQKELVDDIVFKYGKYVIQTCTNKYNLIEYVNRMKSI